MHVIAMCSRCIIVFTVYPEIETHFIHPGGRQQGQISTSGQW